METPAIDLTFILTPALAEAPEPASIDISVDGVNFEELTKLVYDSNDYPDTGPWVLRICRQGKSEAYGRTSRLPSGSVENAFTALHLLVAEARAKTVARAQSETSK